MRQGVNPWLLPRRWGSVQGPLPPEPSTITPGPVIQPPPPPETEENKAENCQQDKENGEMDEVEMKTVTFWQR